MKVLALSGSIAVVVGLTAVLAQEAPKMPTPVKEHEFLKHFVGEWVSESKSTGAMPGMPEMTCAGTMKNRMLGGFWVISEAKSNVPGMQIDAVQTIGYDTKKKKYIGTWVDSMIGHMWHYEGTVDESGKKLTLEAEGPNMFGSEGMSKYRDSYEIKSADEIHAVSSVMKDGKWVDFMTGKVTRKK